MMAIGQTLLALTLAVPLAAILLIPAVRQPLGLLSWAAVPGLAAALLTPAGASIEFPVLVLGLTIQLDRVGAIFLGFGSLLWCFAGAYARSYLTNTERAAPFTLFWLLTLAGSLGTFVAADIVTFYVAFSMMSLATYGLVVHDRTASARRAGRVYIVLAVIGETVLVAAFMLAVGDSQSVLFADVNAALATSQWSDYVFAGLLVGFGIKAGLVPLHVWLPLAHPEAPTPASAVLSGVIVKAGIVGLVRFMPADSVSPVWGDALIVLGLLTAYYGIAVGLMQADAKAILAYSTLSQMGIVVTVLASGLGGPGAGRTLDVAALYASHHGLAKGALFLAVGVVAACGVRALRPVVVVTAFMALAIAGLPLSGGALAKLAIKDALGDGLTGFLVTLSAIGTTLLMLRFLYVIAQEGGNSDETTARGLIGPWAGVVIAAVAVPWLMFSHLTGQPAINAMAPANLWAGLWPMLLALVPALIAMWRWPRARPAIPQGDIVVLVEFLVNHTCASMLKLSAHFALRREISIAIPLGSVETAEQALRRWSVSGPMLVIVAILISTFLAH